jgi:nucleoside-diphosphate-sugar epimerase
MTKRILLTGAAGFTGPHFTLAAQQAGYEVHPLSADLTIANAVDAEVAAVTPSFVVHLAGLSSVDHADQEALYRVNLFGTMNLLNALAKLPKAPERILLASSANVYGNAVVSPLDEFVCPKPVSHYSISKLAIELVAATISNRLSIVIARPFNYTGVGQESRFVIPKLIEHFKRRADTVELGNMQVEREFNDVRTVCNAYLQLLHLGQPGQIYNVCSGRPVSLQTLIDTLIRITGHKIKSTVNPDFVRPNEVHSLCGNPAKLESCIGALQHPPLEETLLWMLSAKV